MSGNYKTIKKLVCGKVRKFVLMPTYDGDIKELWQEWTEDKDAYYVYSYGKLIEGEFNHRYIGIGTFNRYKQAKRHNTSLMGNMRDNQYFKIIVVKCATRERAAAMEKKLINFFGRKDLKNGDLYNLTDGGEYGSNGYVHTEEYRLFMSKKTTGENNPFYGKKHSKATRQLMSGRKGEKSHFWKDKSHITNELIFTHLQLSNNWVKEIPDNWGVGHSTLLRVFEKRYKTNKIKEVKMILSKLLRLNILNHSNFIEYCRLYKYSFLQMANYFFGISGEQLQMWCLRTYSKAESNTINGWESYAKRLESKLKYQAKKKNIKL